MNIYTFIVIIYSSYKCKDICKFLHMQQLNYYEQQIMEVYLDVGFWRKTKRAPYSFLFFDIE